MLAVAAAEAAPASSWRGWSKAPLLELGASLPDPAAAVPELESRWRRRWPPLRTALLALAAMLVVLAAVAAALLLPTLLSRGDEQFSAQLERARQGLAAAALGVDLEVSRSTLRQALGDVNLALEHKPLDQQALDLRAAIEAALAELELVFVPTEFETLVDLGRFGPNIALGAVYLAGDQAGDRLYALDDAGGRVFSISASGVPTVIFSEGAAYSTAKARAAPGGRSASRPTPARSGCWTAAASCFGSPAPKRCSWVCPSWSGWARWTRSRRTRAASGCSTRAAALFGCSRAVEPAGRWGRRCG